MSHAGSMTWAELSAQPLPPKVKHIAYGSAPQQFGELRLPTLKQAGKGPHPVVVALHGGCWLNAYDYGYMTRLSQGLADHGYAVWTPEYRRLGDRGGGWPGTFKDVAAATDHLRVLAKTHRLDLKRVVTLGHSAGGHLALWLATRAALPAKGNALHTAHPLKIRGVVGLAAISDLARYSMGPQDGCSGSVRKLMGGMPGEVDRRYRFASPIRQQPFPVPVKLLHGEDDAIVPLAQSLDFEFVSRAKKAEVEVLELDGLGHFELASTQTDAWPALLKAVDELSGRRTPD